MEEKPLSLVAVCLLVGAYDLRVLSLCLVNIDRSYVIEDNSNYLRSLHPAAEKGRLNLKTRGIRVTLVIVAPPGFHKN